MIQLEGVSKRFANGTLALENLSLSVGANDFISFLGPSGCGKSTALRLIAGLLPITDGAIRWDQTSELSFVFQEPTLMPWARVWDNVYLPLRLKGMSKAQAQERVDQTLEMVGLEQFAQVFPRELSGGMKMRVSIARALVTRPRLLLMDEPFAALDEMTRFKLNNDLLRLWQDQKFTVIFVTHSVYESVYLSNRIVVMAPRPGRVIAQVDVPAPYPRSEEFRVSPGYNALCVQVSKALHAGAEDS
jgi:NitT/TauT family transport system ATP-binding protein